MLAAAASSSTSSSSSSSASSSSPSPPSPLDAVSPDQALAHPTLAALDPAALDRTTRYLDEVLRANGEGLNLTAVRGRGPALLRHCADSLDLLPFIDREEERWLLLLRQQLKEEEEEEVGEEEEEEVGAEEDSRGGGGPRHRRRLFTVVDVGSGGGFPGAALAAARPRWRLVLIDALRKRCEAVSDAARRAGVGNAEVLWSRAEEAAAAAAVATSAAAPPPHDDGGSKRESSSSSSPPSSSSLRESSPVVVARAVAEMRTLAELCLPLVEVGGAWIAPKGPIKGGGAGSGPGNESSSSSSSQLEREVEAAAAAIELLGGRIERIEPLPPLVPGAPERSVVVVRKVKRTPAKYPRGNNLPGRRPL